MHILYQTGQFRLIHWLNYSPSSWHQYYEFVFQKEPWAKWNSVCSFVHIL